MGDCHAPAVCDPAFPGAGRRGAGDARVDRVEIVSQGTYRVEVGEATADPDAPTGQISAPATFTLIEATTDIAAGLGVEFGLEYRIVGEPEGVEVPLDFVISYPAPGLMDPDSSEPLLSTALARPKTIGKVEYLGYGFENDWELVAGTWRFTISYRGRTLAERSFTVTD